MDQQKVINEVTKKQGFYFLIVGSFAALIHFCVLVLCVQILNIHPNYANCVAFFVAFIFGFIGHLHLTFKSENSLADWKAKLSKWFMSSVFGFVLNQAIFSGTILLIGQKYYVPIWIFATAVVTVVSFLFAKFWAFKGNSAE